jgi:L-threonylcarbamoyladenylate synthase
VKIVTEQDINEIAATLKSGGIVVLRTDTIYGIVASANNEKACDTVFAIKQRDADKACIVLVADETQVWDEASASAKRMIRSQVPDTYPSSLIVPIADKTPTWIHHGKQDVAFRIPSTKPWLVELLHQTGPIIAPSANLQGQAPANSIEEAIAYFGAAVDLYVDGGEVVSAEPSHLYRLNNGQVERLR